ncbi:MAG: P-loop NTPase [Pirellula sp.]
MSEVNQAFLRAYLKNRTQTPPNNANANSDLGAVPSSPYIQQQPVRTVAEQPLAETQYARQQPPYADSGKVPARQRPFGTDPARRASEQGRIVRVDSSHASNRVTQSPAIQSPAIQSTSLRTPAANPNATTTRDVRTIQASAPVAPARQGVWSPLGVERGMKAMESVSIPAVVSNGVPSVTPEATRHRRSTQPSNPPQIRQQLNAPSAQYDQVMYVDGLGGAPSTPYLPTRHTQHTLDEITEPIAFGTGLTAAQPVVNRSNRSVGRPPAAAEALPQHPSEFSDRNRNTPQSVQPSPSENPVNRRFDTPHVGHQTAATQAVPVAPTAAAPAPAPAPTPTPTPAPAPAAPAPAAPAPSLAAPSQTIAFEARNAELPIAPVAEVAPVDVAARADSTHRTAPPTAQPKRDPIQRHASASRLSRFGDAPATKEQESLPLPVAFTPSWEVDTFYWPEVVKQIEKSHLTAFQQTGKHLSLANRDGLKVMAITSGERGVGRSTVAMHMARCAASNGLRVALVDGDTYCPSLIDQLRLDIQHGWQDCLFENVPLSEVAVHSIADRITLFPLTTVIPPNQMHANLHRMAKMIKRISTAFDIVFIDASRLNLEQRDLVGVSQESIVDAAIVVVDTELSIKEKVDSAVSILQGMGISSIGLVENFQS